MKAFGLKQSIKKDIDDLEKDKKVGKKEKVENPFDEESSDVSDN